ncbi:MAG: choice-of-anchor D domain-containing protein [Verrucomicrobiales bacterium]|nr:choice-of-anchor D domain-containing protein [Verrucomicrobiales bacterium]
MNSNVKYPRVSRSAWFWQGLGALLLSMVSLSAFAQFVPGSGGTIPDIAPFVDPVGSIGGLRVDRSHRRNDFIGSGNHPVIDLEFFPPSVFGATAYVLQRSVNGTDGWTDIPSGMDVLRTSSSDQDNFSIEPDAFYYYRLRVEGGPRDGQFSNAAYPPVSQIATRFAGWEVDSSLFVTGISSPWVGYGMTTSFDVRNLSDDSAVSGGISLQWFRAHPRTWEMTEITGATSNTYATTEDDVGGWIIVCRATGDGSTVGGLIHVTAGGPVMIPNPAFVSEFTDEGFRLNLRKSVPSLVPGDLQLTYYDSGTMMNVEVPISTVTPIGGNASFRIGVTLPDGVDQFTLLNQSEVWKLGENLDHEPGGPSMFLESLLIDIEPDITVLQPRTKALADNRGKINFGKVRLKKRSRPKIFTVRSDGGEALAGLSVAGRGSASRDFRVTRLRVSTLAPGETSTFKVTFKPRKKGTRKAKLLIRSNDPDESPFDINLIGKAK